MPEVRMSHENICDFCSEPKIGRRFHCQDFLMDQGTGFPPHTEILPPLVSKGDWMACSACGSLIDAENWNGLLLRAVDRYSEKYAGMPRRILTDAIKKSHDLFRQHFRKAVQ